MKISIKHCQIAQISTRILISSQIFNNTSNIISMNNLIYQTIVQPNINNLK